LTQSAGFDKKTVFKYLEAHQLPKKQHNPRPINLVVDATYFGIRTDKTAWGVILFRDATKKENLWWKYVDHECFDHYKEGRNTIESLGYAIKTEAGKVLLAIAKTLCRTNQEEFDRRLLAFHAKYSSFMQEKPLIPTAPSRGRMKG